MINDKISGSERQAPGAQAELNDEQLDQVSGGGVIVHDRSATRQSTVIGPEI